MSKSKFSALFEDKGTAPETPPAPPPERIEKTPEPIAASSHTAARPIGRPRGKRSDPAWKQFSVLLKTETQREATARLAAGQGREARDLSGLLQELLEGWLNGERR